MRRKLIGIALATLAPIASAYANAIPASTCTTPCIFNDSNIPNPSENVILTNGVTGNPFMGEVARNADVKVLFTSEKNILMATSSGQAGFAAVNGPIRDVTVSPIAFGFRYMQINPTRLSMINDITITAFTCHFHGAGLLPTSCSDPEEFQEARPDDGKEHR